MRFSSEKETFKIERLSPALLRASRDALPPVDLAVFRQIFELSCEFGSLQEADFERIPGTSFNPRPARIAQICIDEDEVYDLRTLTVCVLSCCKFPVDKSALPLQLEPNVIADIATVHRIVEMLEAIPNDLSTPIVSVVSAHLLDRARQLHRAAPERIQTIAPVITQRIAELLQLYPSESSTASKLRFWLENRSPQLTHRQ